MRTTRFSPRLVSVALAAATIAILLGAVGCGQAKEFMAEQSQEREALAAREQAAAAEGDTPPEETEGDSAPTIQ